MPPTPLDPPAPRRGASRPTSQGAEGPALVGASIAAAAALAAVVAVDEDVT